MIAPRPAPPVSLVSNRAAPPACPRASHRRPGARPRVASASSALQEAAELFRPRRMPELPEGLGLDLADALARDGEVLTDLLGGVLAAELLDELARGADQLVDRLDHVHRDADRPRLVGDGAGDGLANPPGGVGRELVAAAVLELVDRLHQSDVAFLDQVQELESTVGVLLRDRDDEAEVRLDHFLLGPCRLVLAGLDHGHDPLDVVGPGVGPLLGPLDLLLRHPDLALLRARELLGGLLVEVGVGVDAVAAEGDVDQVLHFLRRRPTTVGPQRDHALGPLDVLQQLPQLLHEAAALGVGILAVDDLGADVEGPQRLEHPLLLRLGLPLVLLPRGVLAAPAPLARGPRPELSGALEELLALAQQAVDGGELPDHHAGQLVGLVVVELLLGDLDHFLDRDLALPEPLPEHAEALDGEVGREDGPRDFLLPLLDALGERDLPLARQQGHPAHLAEVEAHRVLGSPACSPARWRARSSVCTPSIEAPPAACPSAMARVASRRRWSRRLSSKRFWNCASSVAASIWSRSSRSRAARTPRSTSPGRSG